MWLKSVSLYSSSFYLLHWIPPCSPIPVSRLRFPLSPSYEVLNLSFPLSCISAPSFILECAPSSSHLLSSLIRISFFCRVRSSLSFTRFLPFLLSMCASPSPPPPSLSSSVPLTSSQRSLPFPSLLPSRCLHSSLFPFHPSRSIDSSGVSFVMPSGPPFPLPPNPISFVLCHLHLHLHLLHPCSSSSFPGCHRSLRSSPQSRTRSGCLPDPL